MKVDETIEGAINKASQKTGIKSDKVLDMLNKYYSGVEKIIQDTTPAVIKIDFFGKLIYNHAWRNKVIENKKKKDESI